MSEHNRTRSIITERVLLGPGPCNPYPEATAALSRPVLGHMDPEFIALLDDTNARLRAVFNTDNELTFPVSGTGSAGMEAAFVNVIRPGDVAVIAVNGVFGTRMCDVAERCGAEVIAVHSAWGKPVDTAELLAAHPNPAVMGLVHAETSTGALSDIAPLANHHEDTLLILDCVTSLGGMPVRIDDWGVDIAYSGTQKCLSVPPGLSPFTVSPKAVERIVEKPRSWYLDLNMIAKYASGSGGRAYHHTAPISMIFSLHAGLGRILDEGLVNVFQRHADCAESVQAGLMKLGCELFAEEGSRLNSLTSVWVPEDRLPSGASEADIRSALLNTYGIEIGGGLGEYAGKIWRIGTMGHNAQPRSVRTLLGALEELLD